MTSTPELPAHRRLWAGGMARRVRNHLAKTLPAVCELCGEMIGEDDPWDVDHVVPLKEAPHLALDMSNVRPAHSRCNRRRGAGLPPDPDLCMRGHRLEGDNVKLDRRGRRRCRECDRIRTAEWRRQNPDKVSEAKRRARVKAGLPEVGPSFRNGERGPSLLERGQCPNGHTVQGPGDIKLSTRVGTNGQPYQNCRRCLRESARRAGRTKSPGVQADRRPNMLERGECPRGHRIEGPNDVYDYLTPKGRSISCRECRRQYYDRKKQDGTKR